MTASEEEREPGLVPKGRLEAFSDGVFAIAVTLLILEVKVSGGEHQALAQQLRHAWPSCAAYLISFTLIGTMWINHHGMFKVLRGVSHSIIVANMALLLVVSFVPFPTKLVGEHLSTGTFDDRRAAVVLYSATMVGVGVVFSLLWWAVTRDRRLLEPQVTPAMVRSGTRRNLMGLPLYFVILLVAFGFPKVSLALSGVLGLFYLLPQRDRVSGAAEE